MDLADLTKPFAPDDIEWRVQRDGVRDGKPWALVLAYVTNRAIMDRLDNVVGPENWRNEYQPGPSGGVLCGLSLRLGDEWITKWDGADNTQVEEVKGGLSGAMKRAAVQWGIGRYLYHLEATFAHIHEGGKHRGFHKDSKTPYRWDPPGLPQWALPQGSAPTQPTKPEPREDKLEEARRSTEQLIANNGLDEGAAKQFSERLDFLYQSGDLDGIRRLYKGIKATNKQGVIF
jgi:hypothetical protein